MSTPLDELMAMEPPLAEGPFRELIAAFRDQRAKWNLKALAPKEPKVKKPRGKKALADALRESVAQADEPAAPATADLDFE